MRWISASSEASCSAFGGRRDRVAIDAAVPEVMPGASAFFMSVAPAYLQSSVVPAEAGIQRLRSNAPLGPRLRGDDKAFFHVSGARLFAKLRRSRGSGNPASFARTRHRVRAFAGTTKPFFHVSGARLFAKLRRSRGSGNPASSLERATGSPPSRGRQSLFSCQRRPPVCKAPSFPRKREPSVFRSNAPLGPAFAGTTNPFFHVSGARLFAKLRRSRGSGNPASFARTRHRVPAFAGTTKPFFH